MNKTTVTFINFIALFFLCVNFVACSKSDSSPAAPSGPVDPCLGKTIAVNATPTASTACANSGSIVATASGSTNFTYKLNSGGVYQALGSFTNLAAGDYTIFAKDGAGCEKSVSVTIASSGAAGTTFTAVKNLIASKCQSCHNNSLANGGMNFQVECNIVKSKDRIKVRAVDEGTMPQTGPLTQAEKDIISAWITAGGAYNN
jgi:hypothetical protein